MRRRLHTLTAQYQATTCSSPAVTDILHVEMQILCCEFWCGRVECGNMHWLFALNPKHQLQEHISRRGFSSPPPLRLVEEFCSLSANLQQNVHAVDSTFLQSQYNSMVEQLVTETYTKSSTSEHTLRHGAF